MAVILGIDPGLANTGYGVIQISGGRTKYLIHGVIETASKMNLGERLSLIYDAVSDLIRHFSPESAGIENLYFAKNRTSAIPVAQARGILLLSLFQNGVTAYEFPPQEIKQALTGNGRASKEQVQEMVRVMLGLKEIPKPDHASDALAVAICCYHSSTAIKRGVL